MVERLDRKLQLARAREAVAADAPLTDAELAALEQIFDVHGDQQQ